MKKKNSFFKKKIEISSILNKIEVNFDNLDVINQLDNFFNSPKGHVVGITGPPGVGKSSMIKKTGSICRHPSSRSILKEVWWCYFRR